MNVRAATADDLDALMSLWRELEDAQGRFRLFPPVANAHERIAASFRDALTADDADVLLVLDDDNVPIAMALIHVEHPSRLSADESVELSRVVVRSDHRGEGIGRLLVDATADWARARGIRFLNAAVFVANEASHRFWRAAGFESWVDRMVRPVDP